MTEITPRLFIGGIKQASNKSWLKKKGITSIVNCAIEVQNYFPNDFTYLRLDMQDSENEIVFKSLEKAFKFMEKELKNPGKKILVHCYVGMSRSSSTLIYFLMKYYGESYSKVYKNVKKKHPITHPNPGYNKQLEIADRIFGEKTIVSVA